MTFGNSYNGGRTRYSTKVFLNVYDLAPANDFLWQVGLGLHHSGVEVLGCEFSFASGAGVFDNTPGEAPGARFREKIEMGSFEGGKQELQRALDDLRSHFGPDDYNLIKRNCNHFANALCWKLLNKTIPGYVNRLADIGACCSCLLPRKMLEQAPVGDPSAQQQNSSSTAPSSSFMVRPGKAGAQNTTSVSAFSGSGARLGGDTASKGEGKGLLSGWTTSTSSSSSSSPQDELTDRREKARKAALARLERSQQKES